MSALVNPEVLELIASLGVNEEDVDVGDGDSIVFSVPVVGLDGETDPDALHQRYEELYALQPTFQALGYRVHPQEDPDYFGAELSKVLRIR